VRTNAGSSSSSHDETSPSKPFEKGSGQDAAKPKDAAKTNDKCTQSSKSMTSTAVVEVSDVPWIRKWDIWEGFAPGPEMN